MTLSQGVSQRVNFDIAVPNFVDMKCVILKLTGLFDPYVLLHLGLQKGVKPAADGAGWQHGVADWRMDGAPPPLTSPLPSIYR